MNQVSETQVNLLWSASVDNVAVTGYRIYRNNNLLGTATTAAYADKGVVLGSSYQYEISAYDSSGNESAKSFSVSVTIKDLTKPSVPTGLKAKAVSSTRVDLAWNASSDNVGVVGYRVYRNTKLIKVTTARTYRDAKVSAGKTYSYQIAAYDAAGNISARSLVVKARQIASNYTERFLLYICANSDLFPEYSTNTEGEVKPNNETNFTGWVI